MDELLTDFLTESGEQLESIGAQLVRFEQDPSDARIVANIFRLVHAIKGTCGFLNLPRLEKVAHAAESLVDRLRDGAPPTGAFVSLVFASFDRIRFLLTALAEGNGEPAGDDAALIAQIEKIAGYASTSEALDSASNGGADNPFGAGSAPPERRIDTVRISIKTLERMMSLVSELVLTRNQLVEVARHTEIDAINSPLMRLSSVTADLQSGVLAARMQPVERLFANLHRLVRDLTAELDKKAELSLQGGGTELDRQLIEAIRDPLTHMIRNAVDHGIESPEQRRAAGKPEVGSIRIAARHQAGQVSIEVSDDGRGLDAASIRSRAVALGLGKAEDVAALADADLFRFVFAPGFTTATRVSNVSGRGVGLDIVRANIEEIGGSISLTSRAGHGTALTLRIPLTLAIVPALIVLAGEDRFALPRHAVEEIIEIDPAAEGEFVEVQGASLLTANGGVLPAARLRRLMCSKGAPADATSGLQLALRMRSGMRSFAILVDEVADVQEIVLKPLPEQLNYLTLFSGSTILGDGTVALVLDPAGLASALGLPHTTGAKVSAAPEPVAPPNLTKIVMFRAGGEALKAAPLSSVARILSLGRGDVEIANGAAMFRHDGRLAPLLRIDGAKAVCLPSRPQAVLLLTDAGSAVGLIVDEIVDIVDEALNIEIRGEGDGVLGVATIRGDTTELIDVFHFLDRGRGAARSEVGKSGRRRILIADSAQFFRDLIGATLDKAGHSTVAAASASEVLDLLARAPDFDAILIDMEMACGNNGELARQIDTLRILPQPCLIGLAAHGGDTAQLRARKAGLTCAVGKFDRVALARALGGADGADVSVGAAA